MLMELETGALCSYQQCHYAPDGWRNYTIIGTEGRIENFCDYHGHTVVRLILLLPASERVRVGGRTIVADTNMNFSSGVRNDEKSSPSVCIMPFVAP